MWLFICLLCFLGTLLTLVKFSLLERKRFTPALALCTAIIVCLSIPWALRINMQGLTRFLNHLDVLNNLCALLVIESIALLLVTAHLMKQHLDHRVFSLAKGIALLPSSACITGLFVAMVFLFNQITGRSYSLIGFALGIGGFVGLCLGALLIRFCIKTWAARLEILLVLSFVQLVLAMFLPLLARGLAVHIHNTSSHLRAFLVCLILSLLFAAAAFCMRKTVHTFMGNKAK